MISQFVGSSPASGSVLSAQSPEPASGSVSPSLFAPPPLALCLSLSKINETLKKNFRDTWVAQSVEHLTSAQVMVSRFVGSSPVLGSVLTAQGLEPASDSTYPSLSVPSLLTLCLSHTNK